jgi:hypothetical protein
MVQNRVVATTAQKLGTTEHQEDQKNGGFLDRDGSNHLK